MPIKRITSDNLDSVILDMLSQPQFFEQIEQVVYEIEGGAAPQEAKNAFEQLSQLIDSAGANRDNLTNKYIKILLALRLVSLSLVKDEEKGKFLEENIVLLLQQDYADLMFWLKLLFAMYEYDKDIVTDLQRAFVQAIERSNDLLGKANITIGDKEVKPFVKYWVLDFRSFPAPRVQRGPLEENTYLSQGINTKSLDNKDLAVLRKLLRIYDWLRFQVTIPVKQTAEGREMPAAPEAPHGASLEAFKQKLEKVSGTSTPSGRPTMGMAKPLAKPGVQMTPQEIKRELNALELPRPEMQKSQPPQMPRQGPVPPVMPPRPQTGVPTAGPAHGANFLADLNAVEDLKKISLADLRQGTLPAQISLIKSKIIHLSQINKLLPYYTVNAFEQSPLFRLYTTIGAHVIADTTPNRQQAFEQAAKKLENQGQSSMTISEFEAVADLRKEIEKL
jgi:hypothetical protein